MLMFGSYNVHRAIVTPHIILLSNDPFSPERPLFSQMFWDSVFRLYVCEPPIPV